MLKIIRNMRELDFSALMEIYAEGNRENGREMWPELPEGQRILMAEQGFYQYLRECFFPTPGAVYCLWEVRGRWVSALRLEPYRDGLLLEALETRPDARRQGYAKALIQAVTDWLADRGPVRVYSHVSKRNQPSLATHKACGFQKILDYAVYADGSVANRAVTLVYTRERSGEENRS